MVSCSKHTKTSNKSIVDIRQCSLCFLSSFPCSCLFFSSPFVCLFSFRPIQAVIKNVLCLFFLLLLLTTNYKFWFWFSFSSFSSTKFFKKRVKYYDSSSSKFSFWENKEYSLYIFLKIEGKREGVKHKQCGNEKERFEKFFVYLKKERKIFNLTSNWIDEN